MTIEKTQLVKKNKKRLVLKICFIFFIFIYGILSLMFSLFIVLVFLIQWCSFSKTWFASTFCW